MFTLISPRSVPNPTKAKPTRVYQLNLNMYRNTHFQVLNKMKHNYEELMRNQIMALPLLVPPVRITYEVYVGTFTDLDIMNVVSVLDKFFCDSLVNAGKLPDDNYRYLVRVTSYFGGYCKGYPHVKIHIRETNV